MGKEKVPAHRHDETQKQLKVHRSPSGLVMEKHPVSHWYTTNSRRLATPEPELMNDVDDADLTDVEASADANVTKPNPTGKPRKPSPIRIHGVTDNPALKDF